MSMIDDDLGISLIAVFPAALYDGIIYSAGPIWWPKRVQTGTIGFGHNNALYGYRSQFMPDPPMSARFSRVMAFNDSEIGLIAHGPLHKKSRYRKEIFIKAEDGKHVWYIRRYKSKLYYPYDMWSDILHNTPSPMWKIHKRIKMSKLRPELVEKALAVFGAWISGDTEV